MSILFSLLSDPPYLTFPQGGLARTLLALVWLVGLCFELYILYQNRSHNQSWTRRSWITLAVLLVAVPFSSLFFVIRFTSTVGLTPPGLPIDPQGASLLVFAALPWVMAAGLLGPTAAAVVAGASGFFLAFWATHNPFTIHELVIIAILFAIAARQRYRTKVFRLLRHPLLLGVGFSLLYPLIFLPGAFLLVDGSPVVCIDFAITQLRGAWLAMAGSLIFASFVAEIFTLVFPSLWGVRTGLLPSPVEGSLEGRYVYILGPLVFLLAVALMVGAWNIAEHTSRQMIEDRLTNLARLTSESIPYFLEVGQSLMAQLVVDQRLDPRSPAAVTAILEQDLRVVPFFDQLYMLDARGSSIAGYPQNNYFKHNITQQEYAGIERALDGVPFQVYSSTPNIGQNAARISFMAAVFDPFWIVKGVLIGQTDLVNNPFSGVLIDNLKSLKSYQGEGIILDEDGTILYHPLPGKVMTQYQGRTSEYSSFFDEIGPDGTRQLVYYQPAHGRSWAVVLIVPARQAQQIAITIAAPLFALVILVSVIAAAIFHLSMRKITVSLRSLAEQSTKISQGRLDQPVQIAGEDEVGQLGQAFEQMRKSLKDRLEEQERMLKVTHGVASSLEMSLAVAPILESALASDGAVSARIVLEPEILPELVDDLEQPLTYSAGEQAVLFQYLDQQVIEVTRSLDRVVLSNPHRPHLFTYPANVQIPNSLLAIALRYEPPYFGAFWVTFDQPHNFSGEEVRFMITLAEQAALAASNARLFLNAEIGRQRLEAILSSTPDPILVTDQKDQLLLVNPAALQVLGLELYVAQGQRIQDVIKHPALQQLLLSPQDDSLMDITLEDGKTYSATASTVLAGDKPVGRVCLMRDVTYFKDMNQHKSDFVATVSHDLRSPLTLMRGYATMLEMVGQLNDQQSGYVRKILDSVEGMNQLVTNLLDLGRIEAGIGLQLELISVRDILERVIGGLQLSVAQQRVNLTLELHDQSVPLLEADPALLQEALHNLLENAIKFSKPDGSIQVRAYPRDDHMIFEVKDTGIGIAHVDLPHVFDKFYRVAQPGGKRPRGTGLGLAIVKSIAEQHHGDVKVESQLGKGSTFTLELPLKQNRGMNQPG